MTRDAGPNKPRNFLGFAEKSPRGPYIVGQLKVKPGIVQAAGPGESLAGALHRRSMHLFIALTSILGVKVEIAMSHLSFSLLKNRERQ